MADIALPRRGTGSAGSQRGIAIPDQDQVQQVAIARDPGLRVPSAAFDGGGKGVEELGAGLIKFGQGVQRARERQQKLFDAIATTEAALAFDRLGMAEFNRRQTEDDPTRPDFMSDYEKWLVGTRNPDGTLALGGQAESVLGKLPEGVSDEAKNALRLKLQAAGSGMVDAAGRLHLQAGQAKSIDLFGQQANQWAAQAARDPDFLESILGEIDEGAAKYEGAWTADQHRDQVRAARSGAILNTVEGLVNKGRFLEADNLLAAGKYDADLTQTERARAESVIDAGRRQKVVMDDKAQRDAEKALKDAQDMNEIGLVTRMAPDSPNPPTIAEINALALARRLRPDQHRMMIDRLTQGDAIKDDGDVYFDLVDRIQNGEDVRTDIRAAVRDNKLKGQTGAELLAKQTAADKPTVFGTHDYKEAVADLKAAIVTTGPLSNFDPGQQDRFRSAMRDLDVAIAAESIEVKDAGKIKAIVDGLVPRYRSSPPSVASFKKPLFGEIQSMDDLRKVTQATVDAFRQGRITRQQLDAEDALLGQIEAVLKRQSEIEEATKKSSAGTMGRK